jgi:hypothetical protein
MSAQAPDPPKPVESAASLAEAMGGAQGVAESSLPAVAFVAAYTISGSNLELSAAVAVGMGAVLCAVRLARRETLQFALSGLVGVGLAAFVATRTNRAEDFFLPGILLNAGYAVAYAVSILVRWPLLGVLVGLLTQEGSAWRRDPDKLRAYSRASWIWVGLFGLRLAVQLPLYLAGAVVALGTARIAMGLPLFLVGIWLSFLVLRREGVVGTPARQAG